LPYLLAIRSAKVRRFMGIAKVARKIAEIPILTL
jgi:hypothetical protein